MDKLVIFVAYFVLVSFIIKADEEIQCPKQCQCENSVETGLKLKCENITTINEILFGNISSEIAYLNLTSNYISRLDSESFQTGNFTKLTKLDIANNHLTNIFTGALDNLPALKYLDISANPLACDCELAWILDYTRNYSIRLKPPPKCQTPEIFRGQSLRKIRIGEDIHCSSQSASFQPQLELIPDKSQLIFEGDSLTLMCRAPRLALAPMRDHEDVAPKSNIYWGWSEKIVHPSSKEDLTFENPTLRFPSVMIDEKLNANSGFLQSVLRIPYVTRNHSGLYDCTIQQQKGDTHISKRVSVLVISDNTKYCQAQETTDNKGSFSWPKTIRGNIVKLPCFIEGVGSSSAMRRCNENGVWGEIDASGCPFTRETTRVLEQFAKMNLSIPRGNVLESAKRLMDFTSEEYIQDRFKDPLDVVFIGKTVESYLEFIHLEKELCSYIINIVSNVMEFPKILLDQAQVLDRTSNKLIDAAERAASFTISSESQKHNLAIELFQIPHDVYVGISCSWERHEEQSRTFICNTATKSYPSFSNIDASIQFPATQYSGSPTHRLLVSVFNNNKFFPENKSQGSYLVTSSIIGAKLVPMTPILTTLIPKNLSEPIFIALKAAPFHEEISQPKPVWWDETMNDGLGGWSFSHGCQSFHYIQGIFMFTCNRLGFYALVQHSSALNDFPNEESGARFKLSPIGFYVGSSIIFLAAWLNIVTYTMFFDSVMMGRRVKHSLINTWISMAMLAFMFAIGIYQTENAKVCQLFGVTIHYLTLCVLLWICISVSNMYKRVSRNDRIGMEDDLPREEPRLKKPILGLYLLGYGVGLLICGINLAVNLKEYASYTHCFMDTSSELGALLLPSSILLFFLLIMFICIRFHLRNRVICNTHLSEGGTEALEIDLLESNHAVNAARSVRSFSTQPTTSVDDFEATPRTQLKSYIIVLVLYLLTWISAGIAVSIPSNGRLIYEEEIFSIAFAIFSMLLGSFIVFFYGFARSDVRGIWSRFKCCGKFQKTIAPKEYEQTTTTSVLYHQPMNLSRSNSQNSRGRPLSVGSIRLKTSNDCQSIDKNGGNFMMTMQRHQMSVYGDDTSTVEMFYNPNQSNAARKFFKKQKRLQKLNNIDVQKRNDFNDGSSDISSTIMSVSKPVSEMFGTSSKVNNTNIHVDENKTKSKQFSNSVMSDSCNESELFMDICNEGLRFSTLKSKINNTDSKMYTNFLDNQTTIQEVLKKKIEENKQQKSSESSNSNPPLYVNTRSLVGKTIQEVNEASDHDVEVVPLTVKTDPTQAMNTVGLPSPPPQKQEDEANDLQLDRDATYISASLEISGKSDMLSPKPSFKSKSLDQLNVITSLNYHESHTRSISFNNITFIDHDGIISSGVASSTNIEFHRTSFDRNASLSMISNQDNSTTSPPVLIAPSMCDIDKLDDQINLNDRSETTGDSTSIDNLLNNHSQNGLDYTPTMMNPDNTQNFNMFSASNRSSSPISFSDINYQNSELSSQDLYAPPDNNDIDYMLTERDHFRISDDEDIDNGNSDFNCSRDLLIHPCQTDEDGIDQLYEQVRGNDLSNKSHKPPPPPKPKNIKVTRNYVFQYPTLLSPDDDDSSIIQ